MTNNDDDKRTTAIGLARYAREFLAAALATDEKIGEKGGYEITAPAPVLFLVAHSIELALKAYLRHQGHTVKDIIRLGHDLRRCLDEANSAGLAALVTLSKGDIDVLAVTSDLHDSTELRYIRTGSKIFPVFGPLENVAGKLNDAICPHVGYH